MDTLDDQIAGIAALDEPVRRQLYHYVAAQARDVSRDEAAAATGISRALAAFHLDKLAEEGLLDVAFRRLTGRTGPGAGRPSKLYRRSHRQITVNLPPRSYELAARLLARTVDSLHTEESLDTLGDVAHDFGEDLGAQARRETGVTPTDPLDATLPVLNSCGYEPFREPDGTIRMRNCPFHALANEHRGLVCGMNHALMQGFVDGLQAPELEAALEPRPGMCCVALRKS
jgi:predicted ArsR family transcriptional regulator